MINKFCNIFLSPKFHEPFSFKLQYYLFYFFSRIVLHVYLYFVCFVLAFRFDQLNTKKNISIYYLCYQSFFEYVKSLNINFKHNVFWVKTAYLKNAYSRVR